MTGENAAAMTDGDDAVAKVTDGDSDVAGMIADHFTTLRRAVGEMNSAAGRLTGWGTHLAAVLCRGGRLLACGNGGSAAEAQHLTAELVGRFRDERTPLSAIALHADTSALTAIANDYGEEEMFARGVRAHGRPGDVLVVLSTSGTSRNVVAAAKAATDMGLRTWAFTGPMPNPLASMCDDAVCVEAPSTATVQEVHLLLVHGLCMAVDDALEKIPAKTPGKVPAKTPGKTPQREPGQAP